MYGFARELKDQNENGRLDFMEEGTWGGLQILRHIWTHFTSIVTLITTTFRWGRVTFCSHGNCPFERVTFHFESITLLFERYRIAFRTHFVTFRTYFITFFMFRYFTKRNFPKRDFATDGAPYLVYEMTINFTSSLHLLGYSKQKIPPPKKPFRPENSDCAECMTFSLPCIKFNLSSGVVERWTATGSKTSSLFICLDTTTFVLIRELLPSNDTLKVISLKLFYYQTFFDTWHNQHSWYEH